MRSILVAALALGACAHTSRQDCLREIAGSKRRPVLRFVGSSLVGESDYEATLDRIGSARGDRERSRRALEVAFPLGMVGTGLGASGTVDALRAGPRNPGVIAELSLGVPIVVVALSFAIASGVYRGRALDAANDAARAVGRCPP